MLKGTEGFGKGRKEGCKKSGRNEGRRSIVGPMRSSMATGIEAGKEGRNDKIYKEGRIYSDLRKGGRSLGFASKFLLEEACLFSIQIHEASILSQSVCQF